MSDQLFLPGLSKPFADHPAGNDRLFLAILPGTVSAGQIARITQQFCVAYGLRARPYAVDRLHATLHHLGDFDGVPEGMIAAACEAAAEVAASAKPFEVRFDRVQSFQRKSGKRPFVLLGGDGDNAGLMDFQNRLGSSLGNRGVPHDKKFKAHVTMLRDEQTVPEVLVEPVIWTVKEFVLIHSLLGQTRYILLDRWMLGG